MKFQVEQAIEILSQTPQTLKSLLGSLSDEWIKSSDDKEEWSPFDIVGHLIHGEKTDWIPRSKIILAQGKNRTFESFDRLAQFEVSKDKSLHDLLDEFKNLRNENINTLKGFNLSDEKLALRGIHPELGEVNLKQLISTWVVHDLTHLRQISVFLAKKYSENVGVWKEYLSILK